jgi:RNA polymerase sporulation-specific sigma factor
MGEQLSELERNILKLYLSGHTYEEMAAFFNLSTKSVDNALQRVRRKLRLVFKMTDQS